MNQTTADSKKIAILVGGDTIVLEDGKLEMPPEQAKNAKEVLNSIFEGLFQEIKVGDCNVQDMNFSKEQRKQLELNREQRKTKKALLRRQQVMGR